ncbi:MAG: flippase [Patescibacteria group bacterium]
MFRRIAYNTAINFGAKIIATLLGIVSIAVITRYLGTAGFGHYTTIMAFVQFFGILSDFGLTLVTSQLLAKPNANEQKILSNLFTFRFFTALVFLGIAPLAVLLFNYSPEVKLGVAVASLSFFFSALCQIFIGFYQTKLLMARASLAEVGGRFFLTALVVAAAAYDFGLLGMVIATVAGGLAQLIINYLLSLPLTRLKFSFDREIWKEIILLSWPLACTIALNLIYLKADTIILSLLKSPTEVGLYGASYRVIDILVALPFILSGIALPQITAAFNRRDAAGANQIIQRSFDALAIFALPVVIGAQFVATPLMILVAGKDFAPAGPILQLLVIACGAIYLGAIFSHAVIAVNKQKKLIPAYFFVAVTALAGYLIFIPRYSYFGAAGITIYSEIMMSLLTFVVAFYYLKFAPNLKIFFKALTASLIMAFVLYLFPKLNIFSALSLAAIAYAATLGILIKKEVKQLFNL